MQLQRLKRRLNTLVWQRLWKRWAAAAAGFGAGTIWILFALFACDWQFDMDATQRAVGIAIALLALGWTFKSVSWPWILLQEDQLQVALQVERQLRLESDLVAALQFEHGQRRVGESEVLQQQVIQRAAATDTGLVCGQTDWDTAIWRRTLLLAVSVAAAATLILAYQNHARAFAARLAFQSHEYPTATRIEAVFVNGRRIPLRRAVASVVANRAVDFRIEVSGELPSRGRIELASIDGPEQTSVRLAQSSGEVDVVEQEKGTATYEARIERFASDATYHVRIGDARLPAGTLRVLDEPLVEVGGRIEPPSYTGRSDEYLTEGAVRIQAAEGSAVHMQVASRNKSLESAWLTVSAEGDEDQRFPLESISNDRREWGFTELPPSLRAVASNIEFALQVTDDDGIQLRQPIRGSVVVERDQPPTATVTSHHALVLPTARPRVRFVVSDDIAISQLRLQMVLQRPVADGETYDDVIAESLDIPLPNRPIRSFPYEGSFLADLSPLSAVPGERIRLSVEAIDFRGEIAAAKTRSDAIYWQVADETAVLNSIAELDERTEQRLTSILNKQMEVRNSQ